jgi:glycosyltransferase involved in cell wall biosynthesis
MSEKKPNVRIVFYGNCLGQGGAHQSMLAWFDLLRETPGFELKILCSAEGWFTDQLRRRGLPYTLLPMPAALGRIKHGTWQRRWLTAGRVLSMGPRLLWSWLRVAALRADVVVLSGGRDFIMLLPLVLRRRRHTVTIPQTTDWGEIPTCRLMCRLAARTYAISDSVAESITAMGIAPRKVSVLPLIYTTDHTGQLPPPAAARRRLGLPGDAPVIGMTGVIRPHKGQRDAILVFAEVVRRIPAARLVLVGAPADTEESRAYARGLHDLVRERGLQESVHFLGWRDDVPAVLRAMDVMLVPSHDFEGVPRVILEALEAGLPLVATDLPQFREVIGRHRAGSLHPVTATARWAEEVVRLLQDGAAWTESSRRARGVWEKLYSRESVRTAIVRGFQELAPSR